ncbi:MAG: macrolide ABC transporter ATP-binding protein [Gammaproteobacteria bacterium]|nr:MAG: macrolide ABC transporter ATP-binding protein [Gammaproteobacteria bacterium]
MSIIKTENLVRHFTVGTQTVEALRGVSLDINKGEFVAIMGPSGSGKSTLMNIIGCLDSPTSGTYYLNNKNVSTLDDDALALIRNHEIGFVFQNFHLLARNTALDNVMLPLKYAGIDKSEQEEIAMEVIKSVDLESRAHHQPSELSGGQQQRVAIARALVNKPSILFADEPTGNLDSKTGDDVMNLFTNLHKQGQTIIVITHEIEVANQAERIISIKDGKIFEDQKVLK